MTTETTTRPAAGETLLEAELDRRSVSYGRLVMVGWMIVTVVGIPFIPFGLLLSLWYHPEFLRRLSARLTTRNVEIHKGVFFLKEITIPLNRITDVRLHDDPIMRHLGLRGL